ncbi:hypothetical protein T492DRAFT_1152151 [Pavlovales sp. CCMP2436]|nr:hypothetical protein T492DRAFT_1152151 [Pavlovales sp. CCMP2436]
MSTCPSPTRRLRGCPLLPQPQARRRGCGVRVQGLHGPPLVATWLVRGPRLVFASRGRPVTMSLRHDAYQQSFQLNCRPMSLPPPPPPPLPMLPPATIAAVVGDSGGGRGHEPSAKRVFSAIGGRRHRWRVKSEPADEAWVGVVMPASAQIGGASHVESGIRTRWMRAHREALRAMYRTD